MSVFLAVLVVVAFALTVDRLRLPERAREVGRRAMDCLGVLRDVSLDDEAKARAMRGHALRLFALFGILAGGSVLALGLPLLSVWILDGVGVASLAGVLSVLERADFLAGTAVVGVFAYLFFRLRAGR